MAMKLIEVKNVSKSFGDLNVLDDVSLEVNSGESVAIIGPSGVGKSTLLRIITGLESLDSGSVEIFTKRISMVFQYSALLNSYSVSENISLALHDKKLKKSEQDQIVREKLNIVGLDGYENSYPDKLSGGQRKRVAFARAIASDPELILYDEPTAGLDPILSTLIEDYINKLSKELKVASIVVTHQMSSIKRTAQRIIMLYEGKIVYEGKPDDFMSTNNPYVKQFINADVQGPIKTGLVE